MTGQQSNSSCISATFSLAPRILCSIFNFMLTVSEEILLLVIDDASGEFLSLPIMAREHALAGAMLMDLAFARRIDCDQKDLHLVEATPVDDPILNEALSIIAAEKEVHSPKYWVEWFARQAADYEHKLLDRLIDKGILRKEEHKFLWVFSSRRYPVINNREEREVKYRISSVLFSDEIPEARDIAIICLASACNLLEEIFSAREVAAAQERIQQVCRMDLIGNAVFKAIADLRMNTMNSALQGPPLSI